MKVLDICVVCIRALLILEGVKERKALERLEKTFDHLLRMMESLDSIFKGRSSKRLGIFVSIVLTG
jgi:hypothetical protein